MLTKKKLSFLLLITLIFTSCISEIRLNQKISQPTISSNILKEADNAFAAKDYTTAYKDYQLFYKAYPNSKQAERALYRLIYISYKEKKWDDFALYARKFLSRYYKSRYKLSVLSMRASFYISHGLNVKATEDLVKAWHYAKNEKEKSILKKQIDVVMKNKSKVDNEEIYRICLRYRKTELSEYILYLLGKETNKDINKYWNTLYEINPYSKYLKNTPVKKPLKVDKRKFNIGIMIPLNNMTSQEKAIYNGIKMALKEYNFPESQVIFSDTRRDPYTAAIKVQTLINNYGVDAIIGPLYSDVTLPVELFASQYNIPVISPLATNQTLYTVSDNIFLINNTYLPIAKTLAEYTTSVLLKDTSVIKEHRIAILYPETYKGKTLADYFLQFLRKDGADIVIAVSYNPGEANYKESIKKLLNTDPDIIFVPAEGKEIPVIAPQLLYHYIEEWQDTIEQIEKENEYTEKELDSLKNITLNEVLKKITILGGDGWLTEAVLQMPSQYTSRVIACKLPMENTEAFIKFGKRYYRMFHEEPSKSAALGYDAVSSVLSLWKEGYKKDLLQLLKSKNIYKGVVGNIVISNSNLPLYRIRHNKMEPIILPKEEKHGGEKE